MTDCLARTAATFLVFCAVLVFAHSASAQAHPANPPHWSYSGADGPDHWGDLESDYAECNSGHRESPIDIVGAQPADLAPIHFNYEAGSSITINGTALPLVQFHFHHVSENEIDGKKYDMELHFVHVDSAANRTAVVAVFIKSGAENAALRDLWSHIPHDVGKEVEYKKVVINAADLLPADQNYYTFDGSLTIPPCKEGVKWFVMKTPIEASPAQIAAFAKYYPDNARPIQPTNGREIHESNFH